MNVQKETLRSKFCVTFALFIRIYRSLEALSLVQFFYFFIGPTGNLCLIFSRIYYYKQEQDLKINNKKKVDITKYKTA